MAISRLETNFFVVDRMKIKKQMSNVIVMWNELEVLKSFNIAILALKALTEIKKWKIVKPLFSEKWMKKKVWKNSAGW